MADDDLQFPIDDATEYYAILNLPRDAPDDDVRRAYRALAQVYHPDKHTDPGLKERAQEVFGKLQEAYEVLSDPNRRQIYDVYGKTGLAAGFELGTKLESVEDLKRKWEEFRKKQEAERNEQLSNHRGTYQCRLDASDLAASLSGAGLSRPLLRAAVVQNSVDTPVGDGGDVFYMQGQAVLRNNAGLGNLIFGYRRVLSPHDTLDGNVLLGLRCALSATSTRQVTPYTTASLTASYTAGVGTGMQVTSTRQLPYNMQATLGWVVGPSSSSGMTFAISKRGAKYVASAKLELGSVTAVSGRLMYHVNPTVHVRAILRAGTTGIDLELGAGRKWGPSSAGYLGTVVGLQGVSLKGRVVRSGQTFEVPVVISHSYSDVRALAVAYLLPPLAYVTVSRCVVRPLLRWSRARRERRQQEEHAEAVRDSLRKADTERALIEPVARRKARSEAAKLPTGGLIILDAVYGRPDEYLADGGPQQQAIAAAASAAAAAATATSTSEQQPGQGVRSRPPTPRQAAAAPTAPAQGVDGAGTAGNRPTGDAGGGGDGGSASTSVGSGPDGAAEASATGAAQGAEEAEAPPPPWLSVTSALQYQVTDSRLVLHPGVPKRNQMGFADPTPGSDTIRQLYVAYLYGSLLYEVRVDDTEGLTLPGAGEAVWDAARRRALLQLGAKALELSELLPAPAP